MLMSCSDVTVRPVSSAISRAAVPEKVVCFCCSDESRSDESVVGFSSSSMPAGSSVKDSEPAGMRGCTVRMM